MAKPIMKAVIEQSLALLPSRAQKLLLGSEILRRFLRLASWSVVAFALDKAAMLIIVFFLARILGAADYGRLTLAQGLVNSAQTFVVLGAGSVLGRYIPAMREDGVRRAVEIINLCALVVLGTAVTFTAAGLIGAPIIATSILEVAPNSPLSYLLVAWVLLTALNSLLLTITLSFEKGSTIGLVSLVAALLSVASVPLAALHLGLSGAVAALIIIETVKSALLLILYARFLANEGVSILTPIRRSDAPLMWRFGLPVFLNSALWAPTIWLAQLIVKTVSTDGLTAVGVFGFTNSLLGAVILLSSLTNRAALPIQASLHAKGAHESLTRASWLMALVQTGAALAIAIPVAAAAPFIMASAGDDFAPHWPVLIIMLISGVLVAGQAPLTNHIRINHRPYFVLMTMLPWAVALLGAAIIYPEKGAYALAWGLLVASTLRTAHIYWGWRRFRRIEPISQDVLRAP